MRNLLLILITVLLGINGWLLWQNGEEKRDNNRLCAAVSNPIQLRVKEVKTSLLPGGFGLIP